MFLVSYGAVFLKGFQQQNVVNGYYKSAGFFGILMAVFEIAVISYVVKAGWSSVVPLGLGASLGVMSSMYIFNKFRRKNNK